jgi:hypothetical protein
MTRHISPRTLMLIAGLSILTIILIVLAVRPQTSFQTPAIPSPTPTPFAQSQLYLNLDPDATASGRSKRAIVSVSSGDNSITGIQLEMGFDPRIVTRVRISPDTFFSTPTVLLNDINYTSGRILYALSLPLEVPAVNGSGRIITLDLTLSPNATEATRIFFLPKTVITGEGFTRSVLNKLPDALTIAP